MSVTNSAYKVRAVQCDYRASEEEVYEALKRATDPLTDSWDRLRRVLVPDAAIMDTGVRQLVYVQTGERRFEPRAVTVGGRTGDQALILSGLEAGESVVVQANFLLDSESRLRAAMAAAPPATTPAPAAAK